MAILKRMTDDEIRRNFTHIGLMFGLVPVYIGDPEGQCRIAVRNWWPEWLLDAGEVLMGCAITFKCWLDPHYEPLFPIKITGEIQR
jgi:hypothetical protein